MKYAIQILAIVAGTGGPHVETQTANVPSPLTTFEIEAKDDHDAVNQARAAHTPPDVGGDYEIVVSCKETTKVKRWLPDPAPEGSHQDTERSPCEVCRFAVRYEPHESKREEVDNARREKEIADLRAADVKAIEEAYHAKLVAEGKIAK